jgi:hypothetical protein
MLLSIQKPFSDLLVLGTNVFLGFEHSAVSEASE